MSSHHSHGGHPVVRVPTYAVCVCPCSPSVLASSRVMVDSHEDTVYSPFGESQLYVMWARGGVMCCRANSDTQLAARTNSPVVGSLRDGDGKRQKATWDSLLQSRSYILLQGIDYLMSAQPMTYGTQRTVAEMQRCRCKAQHQVCSAQHSIRGRPRWRP